LAGVAFQRHWERQAFLAGGGDYRAPAQWLEDFLQRKPSVQGSGEGVSPSYLPGVRLGSLEGCLPEPVLAAIREALPVFERRIPGYTGTGVLLTGVETRTSSPLRIPRDPQTRQSRNTRGLFPGGEGAGYAGGILSAAIDGIQVAEALALSLLRPRPPGAPDESACGRA
ncbi:MAG: FAD-dependent protein, partial [Cyanobium sp.]